jgi:hypothetical protein
MPDLHSTSRDPRTAYLAMGSRAERDLAAGCLTSICHALTTIQAIPLRC